MSGLFSFLGEGPLVVFLAIVVAALLVAYLAGRYQVAAANEALIVSGRREAPTSATERGVRNAWRLRDAARRHRVKLASR